MTLLEIMRILICFSNAFPQVNYGGNYFIDRFRFRHGMKLPYANGHCSLTSTNSDTGISSQNRIYDCNQNGEAFFCTQEAGYDCDVGRCILNTSITNNTWRYGIYNMSESQPGFLHYGECPDGTGTVNDNYAKIGVFNAPEEYDEDEGGIRHRIKPALLDKCESMNNFTLVGYMNIATNICVEYNYITSTYLMFVCDGISGKIDVYSDANCTEYSHPVDEYSRSCFYVNDLQSEAWYTAAQFEGCYVNNVNLVQPTMRPTNIPTHVPGHGQADGSLNNISTSVINCFVLALLFIWMFNKM